MCTECEYKTTINIEWKKAHPWGKLFYFLRFLFFLFLSPSTSAYIVLALFVRALWGMFMAFMESLRELLCNHKLFLATSRAPSTTFMHTRDSFLFAWENPFSSSSLVTYISCKCDVEQSFKPFTIIGLPFSFFFCTAEDLVGNCW